MALGYVSKTVFAAMENTVSQCLSCGKQLKKGFFAKNTDVPYPSNPDVCFVCGMEGKTGKEKLDIDLSAGDVSEPDLQTDQLIEPTGLSDAKSRTDESEEKPTSEPLDSQDAVEPIGIAAYMQDDNPLLLAICEEINERQLSNEAYQDRYGVSRDHIVDFLWTDKGPDRVWGAMSRKQQINVLEWAEMSHLIPEFVKPETAEDIAAQKAQEAQRYQTKHSQFLFRVKTLQGFAKRTPEFVHISANPEADVCISDSASPDSGRSLGVKTSNIVAAEIVTPGVFARRDEFLAQAAPANKLTNAAAGAALGFLLAGPLGTALGGLYGAGSASGGGSRSQIPQKESDGVGLIGFEDGSGVIVTMSKHTAPDFENLKLTVGQMLEQKAQAEVAAEYKECPMCAEDVKARAKICRYCGHSFV